MVPGRLFSSQLRLCCVAHRQVQWVAVVGSVLVAIGMAVFARMDATVGPGFVAAGMVVAGLGMGLVQPVYTVAVKTWRRGDRWGRRPRRRSSSARLAAPWAWRRSGP